MEFFKSALLSKQNPLVEIFALWADICDSAPKNNEEIELRSFINIPKLERSAIVSIDASLKRGWTIIDTFAPYKDNFNWNEDLASILYNLLISEKCQSRLYVISSLINIISLIIHSEVPHEDSFLILIFQTLLAINGEEYNRNIEYVGKNIIKTFLNCGDSVWSSQSIALSLCFLRNHSVIAEEEKGILPSIGQKIDFILDDKDNGLVIDELLLICKNDVFKFESFLRHESINHILDKFILDVDSRAIEMCALLSQLEDIVPHEMFASIATLVCDKASKLPTKYIFKEIKKNSCNEKTENFEVSFCEFDENSFINGFNHYKTLTSLECEPLESFLDESVQLLIDNVVPTIEEAQKECIDVFLMTFANSLKTYSNNDVFFNCYMVFLIAAARFSRIISISKYINQIMDEKIFNSSETVFTEIEPFIDVIRTHIFEILSTVDPSFFAKMINRDVKGILLQVEFIARIMSCVPQPDYTIFASLEVVKTVGSCLNQLQKMRREGKDVIPELHTVLDFVGKLLSIPKVANVCFEDPYFSEYLLNMIYDTDLSSKIILFFCDFISHSGTVFPRANFSKVFKNFSEKTIGIANELANNLQKALSSNQEVFSYYETFIDDILDIACNLKNREMELNALKIILIIVRQKKKYVFPAHSLIKLYNAINATEGDSPSETTFGQMMNILAQTNALQKDSLFIIKVPSIIVTFLLCFSKSPHAIELFDHLITLCSYSTANCIACHEGGLDTALLDFILTSRIEHRGLKVSPGFSKDIIDTHIYPLICLISQEKSSNAVARRFVKLMLGPKENAFKAADVLNKHITASSNRKKPTFRIGGIDPFMTLTEISSKKINLSFSFSFYLNIDINSSFMSGAPQNILKLSDNSGKCISLLLIGESIYLKLITKDFDESFLLMNKIPSNKWTMMTLSSQKYSPKTNAVGFYYAKKVAFCQETKAVPFEGNVKIEFGGYGSGEDSCAILGPFGLSYEFITPNDNEENVDNEYNLNDEDFYFFSANILNDENKMEKEKDFKFHVEEILESRGALSCAFASGGHLLQMLSNLDKVEDSIAELIIGNVKLVMGISIESQENFGSFCFAAGSLLKMPQSKLTYQLYLAFYSLSDVIKIKRLSDDLFDNIIMNVELWNKATPNTFMRITQHWANIASIQYKETINRQGCFLRLLKYFNSLYGKIPETETVLCKSRKYYCSALHNCDELTKKDCEYLTLLSLLESNSEQLTILYLEMINMRSECFKKEHPNNPQNPECFLNIVGKSENICIATLLVMSKIAPSSIALGNAAMKVLETPFASNVFNSLCEALPKHPGLTEFLSILSISLGQDSVSQLSSSLRILSDSTNNIQEAKGRGWPIIPTVLLFNGNESTSESVLQSISNMISASENPPEELYKVVCAIIFLQGITKQQLGEFACRIVLLCKDFATQESVLAASLLRVGHNILLDEEFFKSPFSDSHQNVPKRVIESFKSLKTSYVENVTISPSSGRRDSISQLLPLLKEESPLASLAREIGDQSNAKTSQMKVSIQEAEVIDFLTSGSNCIANIASRMNEYIDDISNVTNKELNIPKLLMLKESQIHVKIKVPSSVYDEIVQLSTASAAALYSSYEKNRSARYTIGNCPSLMKLVPGSISVVPHPQTTFVQPKLVGKHTIPCRQWELGEIKNVCFTIGAGMIQLQTSQVSHRVINAKDILLILPRGESSIEIFTKCDSIYLDFTPNTNEEYLDAIYEMYPKLDRSLDIFMANFIQNKRTWTNFEFLMISQIFSGKTFHIKGEEPILVNNHKYEEYTQLNDLKKAASLRYELESLDLLKICNEISPNYTCFAQLIKPPSPPDASTKLFNIKPIRTIFNNQMIYIVEKNAVKILNVNNYQLEDIPTTQNNSDISWCGVYDDSFYVLHESTGILEVVSKEQKFTRRTRDISCVSQSNNHVIFCCGGCDVLYCNIAKFPNNSKRTNLFTEKISAIGSNSSGFSVIGTEKCRIHMMSIDCSEAYGAIELRAEPKGIEITEIFNMIVVNLWDSLVFYTTSGTKIYELSFKAFGIIPFSDKGRDFVISFNDKRVIVIDPLLESFNEIVRHERIVGACFNSSNETILVITEDGYIHIIPFYALLI